VPLALIIVGIPALALAAAVWNWPRIRRWFWPDADVESIHLAPRQRELLALIGRGLMDKEIAYEMGLTLPTVKQCVERLRKRLGMANCHRVDLARYCWNQPSRGPYKAQMELPDEHRKAREKNA